MLDQESIVGHRELVRLFKEAAAPRDEPVRLSDGSTTDVYLDPKRVLDTGYKVRLAASALSTWMRTYVGMGITAIGGPTMGADVLSHGIVSHLGGSLRWFSVRSSAKTSHGLGKWIEGTELTGRDRVILTDDVVNTGSSMMDAYEKVEATGATVLAVMPLIDRGQSAGKWFWDRYVPFVPLINNYHLGIEPLLPVTS